MTGTKSTDCAFCQNETVAQSPFGSLQQTIDISKEIRGRVSVPPRRIMAAFPKSPPSRVQNIVLGVGCGVGS